MKKNIILILSIQILYISWKIDTKEFTITGDTKGYKDSTLLYIDDPDNDLVLDSTFIIGNKFKFKGRFEEPKQLVINVFPLKREEFEYLYLWIEAGETKVQIEKGHMKQGIISGSKLQTQASILVKMEYPIDRVIDSIQKMWSSGRPIESAQIKRYNELNDSLTGIKINYIYKYPDFFNSAFILTFAMRKISKDSVKILYRHLNPDIQKSKYGLIVKNYIEKNKKMKIGDNAEDFHLENLNRENIGLSDFKGKYILLEFWGSGCGPCRGESPNLLKNYRKYRDKGFEIVTVSLDKNRKNLENALKKDSMIWTTLSDFKGFNGIVPTIYNIDYIPKSYLINQEGVIIDMDLRGEELNKRLNDIFK